MLMVHALFGKRSSNIIATTVYTLNPTSPHSIKARFFTCFYGDIYTDIAINYARRRYITTEKTKFFEILIADFISKQ